MSADAAYPACVYAAYPRGSPHCAGRFARVTRYAPYPECELRGAAHFRTAFREEFASCGWKSVLVGESEGEMA
ncbi:hypothetical protein D7W09_05635 [bacterium D16-34]|nr:hypothetical protein D7W09_05635 [bacterium D16-34]